MDNYDLHDHQNTYSLLWKKKEFPRNLLFPNERLFICMLFKSDLTFQILTRLDHSIHCHS